MAENYSILHLQKVGRGFRAGKKPRLVWEPATRTWYYPTESYARVLRMTGKEIQMYHRLRATINLMNAEKIF